MIKQLMNFRNKAIFGFLVFFYALGAIGQNSTVTFTIQDPTSQVFSNGTLSYVIVPTGIYNFNGSALNSIYYTPQTVLLDSTGSGSISLPRNDYITPVASQWQFTVCPNTSSTCTTVNITINQASQNISAAVNAAIPPIKIAAAVIPRAYSDAEVTVAIAQGGMYYNTGLSTPGLRVWNGSGWVAVGTGSGGAVNLVENSDGTLTVSPTTGNVIASLNLNHANTWTATQNFSAIVITGLSSTSPVCPNGTGGALTTVGCSGSGGSGITQLTGDVTAGPGSGSQAATISAGAVTTAKIAANAVGTSQLATTGVTAGSYTTANFTVGADGRITSASNGSAGTGTVTNVSSSDSSLTVTNPTTTPSVVINHAHANTYTATQGFSDGAGTPNYVYLTNDADGGSQVAMYSGATKYGGIADNPTVTNMEFWDKLGEWDFCADSLASCSNNIRWIWNNSANIWQMLPSNGGIVIGTGNVSTNVNGVLLGGDFSPLPTSMISADASGNTIIRDTTTVSLKVGSTAMLSANATTVTTGGPLQVGGTVQGMYGSGATPPTPVVGTSGVFIDTVAPFLKAQENGVQSGICTVNNGLCTTGGISDITITPATTAIGAASGGIDTCGTAATVTMTGLLTTMALSFTSTTDTYNSGTANGWNQGLYIRPYNTTAGQFGYRVCNPTSASLTPSSITFNVSAR